MIAAYAFGILLLLTPGVVDWRMGWIYVKLASVVALTLVHHRLAVWRKDFAADANHRPARLFRIVNEVPTLLLLLIVVMVVVKPF
jgi:putative membrane protein